MHGRCGRYMERKKCVVPGEVCAERSERSNHNRKIVLNAQKSAEVIVAGKKRRRTESVGVPSMTGKGGVTGNGRKY